MMLFLTRLRQISILLPFALRLGLSASTATAAVEPSKYGVVDMQAVILNVEEGKQARADLERQIKDKEKELMKKKEELDKMNQEWEKQAPLLNEQARMS
ncbi:MAG: OmpH family outer membrane protein, partial [Proteobacteria bacterium]|nr:OmpH family outer membrane protein [Pseudomonadota bacterium]